MAGRGNRITEFGAVCLRLSSDSEPTAQVLLLMDRESRRWTIPTSLRVPKVHPRDIIQQTTWMTAGLKGPVWKRALGQYSYSRADCDGKQTTVQVRVHIVNVSKAGARDPGTRDYHTQWFAPDEALRMVHEPALGALMVKLPDEVARLLKRMARSPTALDPFRAYRANEAITSRSGPCNDTTANRRSRAARLFPPRRKDEQAALVLKTTPEFRGERGP